MRLQINGVKMIITHKEQVPDYKPHVWFDQKAITNLIGLVPAQDVQFFYTRSHLSALQNCALIFSTTF